MGLELLIGAWCEVRPDLPGGSTLLIAGAGELEDQLRRQAAASGAGESVRLLGRVDDDELVSLYRAADIAVVPTLAHEGFGLVVLEAAACGTPSIVTSVGGLPEAVAALDSELVVPPGDAGALRDRILRSCHARPTREQARRYAERFDWNEIAERHRQIARRAVSLRSDAADASRPLKVVYLNHCALLSGAEIAMLRLLPHLDGVQRHVVIAEDGPLVGALHQSGISTEILPFAEHARSLHRGEVRGPGLSPAVLGATAAYVVRLAVRLRRLAPDLVHTNSMKAGLYGTVAARLAGIPVIWHVRDRIAEDYLPRPAVRLIRQMAARLPTAVLANSRTTLDTVLPSRNTPVIHSILPDVVGDVPTRERSSGGPLTFGVVGRLAPWKGQDFFLRAFAEAFPDSQERAMLVGGALFGEDDYARRLPELAAQLGIAERVDLRGHRSDVFGELAKMDVLVHASITPEPFGQVILEGMAAGMPVIAAGAGGPAEILKHETTGVLYEPKDVGGLASAMQRMRDPELRERLSIAARAGLGPYSPTAVAAQLQQLYEQVVAVHRRRG
jgi:glycosyltransferase involved in cell wall biosynthesis